MEHEGARFARIKGFTQRRKEHKNAKKFQAKGKRFNRTEQRRKGIHFFSSMVLILFRHDRRQLVRTQAVAANHLWVSSTPNFKPQTI
jgi:hypothetical protein